MARPLIVQYPGALYPVTSGGNEKKNIYLDDSDKRKNRGVKPFVVCSIH
jgi:hypothetical protein